LTLRKLKFILYLALMIGILFAASFVDWALNTPQPMAEAFQALQPDEDIQIENDSLIVFMPQKPKAGFVLYPGGRVDPVSYAPAAREIAAAGYLVVITPAPLNLAFFAPDQVNAVMRYFPTIEHWIIGGHSLGGVMAANYVSRNPTAVDGLVLWASYPAQTDDLSGLNVPVLSLSGSLDGLSTVEKIQNSLKFLPSTAIVQTIEGGNHAQFGWYGSQPGDRPALISREEQQAIITRETIAFFDEMIEEIP
jgi:pimeloyl-ACP methyl ester carboxylesterase